MTELVASKVAQDAHLSLVAQRPPAQPPERQQAPVQIDQASVDPNVRRAPAQAESSNKQSDDNDAHRRYSGRQSELTGPSRPRIEVREFDIGKTPAEVVGTQDVVLRFDANDDGRIDLIESQRANRARADNGSFSGLYSTLESTPSDKGTVPDPGVKTTGQAPAEKADQRSDLNVAGDFGPRRSEADVEIKKFSDKALADQGVGSGETQVAQKFYGRGAEQVLGQFAAPQDATPKYSDRVAEQDRGKISEIGTGERKFYDKVAQSEPQFSGNGDAQQQPSYYDRAQLLAQSDKQAGESEAKKYYSTADLVTEVIDPKGAAVQDPTQLKKHVKVTA